MTRSRRHTPIGSITTATTEKPDKRQANQNLRLAVRTALRRTDDPEPTVLPTLRDVSDDYDMAKDGRAWFGRYHPDRMRK